MECTFATRDLKSCVNELTYVITLSTSCTVTNSFIVNCPAYSSLLTYTFHLSYFLLLPLPGAMNTLKQCLHYDPYVTLPDSLRFLMGSHPMSLASTKYSFFSQQKVLLFSLHSWCIWLFLRTSSPQTTLRYQTQQQCTLMVNSRIVRPRGTINIRSVLQTSPNIELMVSFYFNSLFYSSSPLLFITRHIAIATPESVYNPIGI